MVTNWIYLLRVRVTVVSREEKDDSVEVDMSEVNSKGGDWNEIVDQSLDLPLFDKKSLRSEANELNFN